VTGKTTVVLISVIAILLSAILLRCPTTSADDSDYLVTIDHFVPVHSSVPSMTGQISQIYVRERTRAGLALRSASLANQVVLFVHGAGTPAEVAFDVPYQDYSWMAYLAEAGFDVFAMDLTGYGRSSRPLLMNDSCNLAPKQLAGLFMAPCTANYAHPATTLASDWNDISGVVEYVRALRHVDRVNVVAWSLGGPRSGGYVAAHPDKVQKLILLAPAYNLTFPNQDVAMTAQSFQDFRTSWDNQVGCPDQYDPSARDSVWSEMMRSDPIGATWGPGIRRAPVVSRGAEDWNAAVAAKVRIPTLLISGEHDKTVPSARVRELYADLGSNQKAFVDLACSSHNALWERNHLLLFRASLEWLTRGTVDGKEDGVLRLGYAAAKEPQ